MVSKMVSGCLLACLVAASAFGQRSARLADATTPPANAQPYVWKNVKIVDGGEMPGIFTHPAEPGLMYIRGDVGGAYRWDAASRLWIPLMDFLGAADWSLLGIESIALDPTDPNRVYLAAGTFPDQPYSSNGAIFASSDRGASFLRSNLPFKLGGNDIGHMGGERLAVNPFKPEELYLATRSSGLWRSLDHGATWSQMASFPITSTSDYLGVTFVRFDPQHSGTVYAAAYSGGLFRSSDGGATWAAVPGQPTTLPDGKTLRPLRSALGPDGLLYVTYANSADFSGINNGAVYKLNTNDGTWTNITPPAPNGATSLWYGFCAVGVDARRDGTVMVATWNRWWMGDDIYRSTDAGTTWTGLRAHSARDGSLSPWVYLGTSEAAFGVWTASLEIDPFDSDHAIYVGGNTLWVTNDLTNLDSLKTTHWYVGADGIEETVVRTLISPPSGAHLLSGVGDEGGFRHDDFAVSPPAFLNPLMTDVRFMDFAESNPALVACVGLIDYQGTAAGAYSLDGGATWTQFAGIPPGAAGAPSVGYSSMIAVSADGATFVWAPGTSGPAYSRDRGTSWIPCAGAPSGLRVVSDRVNPSKFYGYDGSSGTVYASTDGGAAFVARATGLPADRGNQGWTNEAQPRTVPGREGDVWLPLSGGLYHSTNSGTSFTRISTIESAPLAGFGMAAPSASYPALYVVGTVGGVYGIFRSDDIGASWTRINDDAHQYGELAVITGDPRVYGRVYLGTMGRGILYADIAGGACNLTAVPTLAAVVNSASFAPGAIAPLSMVTLWGTGFEAPGNERSAEVLNRQFPLELGCIAVDFGGVRAPVVFANADQINAQAPAPPGDGPVQVQVIANPGRVNELRSAPLPVTMAARAPALFTWGGRSAAAQHGSDYSPVADPSVVPGSIPAAPGEVVILWGTGFGQLGTEQAGELAGAPAELAGVTVSLGQQTVTPDYAGFSPGSITGLFQINVKVPATAHGDVPVAASVAGQWTQPGVILRVQ
jgi:uncharacterized protein (TIGR03437 family)